MQKNPDMSTLLRLAQSPAGQQLIALLQQSGGTQLREALEKASAGDYAQAMELLAPLLDSPDARKLRKQLEETP